MRGIEQFGAQAVHDFGRHRVELVGPIEREVEHTVAKFAEQIGHDVLRLKRCRITNNHRGTETQRSDKEPCLVFKLCVFVPPWFRLNPPCCYFTFATLSSARATACVPSRS